MALGDSLTEGWCDPVTGDGEPWFGWADRLALHLDAQQRATGRPRRLEFANLAVRGRRVRHVVDHQIPAAIGMGADLVSVLVGGNDLSAVRPDPDRLAARLDSGIAALRASGADVLLATVYDPGFSRLLRPLRGRAAVFSAHVHAIAHRHGCRVLDLWSMPGLDDPAMWSADRLHPSTRGHLAITAAAAAALGIPGPPPPPAITETRRLPTLAWLHHHALPWFARRVRQVSSGDGLGPKIPFPVRIDGLPAAGGPPDAGASAAQ